MHDGVRVPVANRSWLLPKTLNFLYIKETIMIELASPGAIKNAHSIIQNALQQGRFELLEPEAREFAKAFGITTSEYRVATSPGDAVQAADEIGFPVVLKIVSPNIIHKTDVGGVKVGINDNKGVKAAYTEIINNVRKNRPDAKIRGVIVSAMALHAPEVIIGGLRDPQFGPAVMFGMGGVFVELFKDISFRISPLEEYEALEMIGEVKGSAILKGFRNSNALDISALAQTILKVSEMMISLLEIKEIDLNPILVYSKGVTAVDVRVILNRVQETP
ncbi:MAG TPA: acetate--CoA ligase family protein [Candidatus Brocadiaceae bacterium]|nr:acetate--CoA ligase family protein [Candidatus Brocadiaceae bacterium]